MLDAGSPLPEVRLPDQTGATVDLADFRGQWVVVYFYPRDETPGCTAQACDIRDRWGEFEQAGATVVGISADEVDSHARFADRYGLPFPLLADPGRSVIDPFGAWGWRTRRDGSRVEGVLRTTVLVDPSGTVAGVWPTVDPHTHADEVLSAIAGEDGPSSA